MLSRAERAAKGVHGKVIVTSLLLTLLLGLGVLALSLLWRPALGPPEYTLIMTDYDFSPSRIEWQPGQQITLRFVNDTSSVPGKAHEWMIGRGPVKEETVFGLRQGDGFEVSFLEGPLEIVSVERVSMLMVRGLELTGNATELLEPMTMGMRQEEGGAATPNEAQQGKGEMDGMTMGGAQQMPADAQMGDGHGMAEGERGGDEMPAGEQMGEMAMEMFISQDLAGEMSPEVHMEMSGNFMVVIQPGGSLVMRLTVPDKPGVWTFGCFQESGEHFLNGMRGRVLVRQGEV